MTYIDVPAGVPGIRSLVLFRPDTGKHLYALAQELLRGDSPLTPAERELIASYVSSLNQCTFCMSSHAAAARELYDEQSSLVDCVLSDVKNAPASAKMKSLLQIAARVTKSGRSVTQNDIDEARAQGAGDREIHDTVLIAATFCMYNRYVDGLASYTPTDPSEYKIMGQRLASTGYQLPDQKNS